MAIARLRLFLAEIDGREKDLRTLRRQFRDQMERVITYALYREPSVEQTLTMMADVDHRSVTVEQTLQHLGRLRARVEAELESLQLTKGIEAARIELAELEARKAEIEGSMSAAEVGHGSMQPSELPSLDELAAEIRRLQAQINEASEHAVRTLLRQSPSAQVPGSPSGAV
jgi:phage shock protein A